MTHTSGQMPAEHADYCTSCGTAPCTHPARTLPPPRRADVAWLVVLAVLGWVIIALAAAVVA